MADWARWEVGGAGTSGAMAGCAVMDRGAGTSETTAGRASGGWGRRGTRLMAGRGPTMTPPLPRRSPDRPPASRAHGFRPRSCTCLSRRMDKRLIPPKLPRESVSSVPVIASDPGLRSGPSLASPGVHAPGRIFRRAPPALLTIIAMRERLALFDEKLNGNGLNNSMMAIA